MFKSLIIVHLMIREGEPEVTLKYLAQNPHRKLAINHFTEGTSAGIVPEPQESDVLAGMRTEVWRRAGRPKALLYGASVHGLRWNTVYEESADVMLQYKPRATTYGHTRNTCFDVR